MRKPALLALIIAGLAAMGLLATGDVAAQSRGERLYRGHYFNWQQSYDGRIFAWMSRDTYRTYLNQGLGGRGSGPRTVTAGNVVYDGSLAGQSAPGGLVLVELRRRLPTAPTPPIGGGPPPGPQGCPPESHWNVYVQADEGYNYQFKVVVRSTGEAVYVMWSGDPMTWVQATGRARGNQLAVTSTTTVTNDRGELVNVGGTLMATLEPGCLRGTGRTQAGRVPGVPNADGNITVERYN